MNAVSGKTGPFSIQKSSPADSMLALARVAREQGRLEESADLCRQALVLQPGYMPAEIGLFRSHMNQGNWKEAWNTFDVRFRLMGKPPAVTYRDKDGVVHEKPRWRGGPIPRSLLILDEQGMGDTIQFARFLPRLTADGARVMLVTHRKLFHFIEKIDPLIELRPMDEPGSVSGVDAWVPLLSLPQALELSEDADHAMSAPYIQAFPGRVAQWKTWLGEEGFKVGIAWQGNPKAPVDANRSTTLAALAPLACLPGVRLISLQKDAAQMIAGVPFGSRIEIPGPNFDEGPNAFVDTAALMMNLDLVITVDTAVGHIAGALGRPCWLALHKEDADWRWMHGKADTLWYPSVRLFRQDRQGDWWSVYSHIADALRAISVKQTGKPLTPVSIGELLDKASILEIKRDRIASGPKRDNVLAELQDLTPIVAAIVADDPAIVAMCADLKAVNEALWEIEDDIRVHESRDDFGATFIELARAVYKTNDHRAKIKADLNQYCRSTLREEKSYS